MALTNAERQARYRQRGLNARRAIFEVLAPGGHVFRVHASGEIEGFPEGSVVFNHIPAERNKAVAEAIAYHGQKVD